MQSNQSEGRRAAAQSAANEGSSSDEQEDQVANLKSRQYSRERFPRDISSEKSCFMRVPPKSKVY